MPKKKKVEEVQLPPAEIEREEISRVLETNYMPYAMSVIVARAIPQIDGFKPSHRKLLYTMYKMGLMTGNRTKSANVVGSTMHLNPHGNDAIYETLVRLTTDKEALLHPFVDSKGSFGKQYSDMAFAAARYTEVKLDKFCETIFGGIDKDAVDMVPNYDNTTTEPELLPVAFPNILVSPNSGIAVGITSTFCSFNLAEVCDLTTLFLQKGSVSDEELLETLKAPDFTTGGYLIYKKDVILSIYKTGHGSFKLRSKYRYNKDDRCIEIYEIPYTSTLEKIKDTIVELAKENKIVGINDVRDEIDINGLVLSIELKRDVDPDKIMAKLFKSTPLEDSFPCNFNVLIGSVPKLCGVLEIIDEWCAFRIESLRRVFTFEWNRKKERLHLLEGLKKILLDIDKAIYIIRHTENDKEVIPNLMDGFEIDEIQAEFIANIKLRNLNKEYILDNIAAIDDLQREIDELYSLITNDGKIKKYICKELEEIKKKYGKPRRTEILYEGDEKLDLPEIVAHENVPATIFVSAEGYLYKVLKKLTPEQIHSGTIHKYKEDDFDIYSAVTSDCSEILFFTSKGQVYKAHIYDFAEPKSGSVGTYIPSELGFETGEKVSAAICISEFTKDIALFFENGKAVRLPSSVYETKNNRRKLLKAFYDGSPLIGAFIIENDDEYLIRTDSSRALLIKESQLTSKTTRTSSGASVMTLKKDAKVVSVKIYDKENSPLLKESRYRKSALPSSGGLYEEDDPEVTQQKFE